MKRGSRLVAVMALAWLLGSRAASAAELKGAPSPEAQGAKSQLQTAARTVEAASSAFDGGRTYKGLPVLRREGPFAVLAEKQNILLSTRDEVRRMNGFPNAGDELVHVAVYGDRQTVGIEDRKGFIRGAVKEGVLYGALSAAAAGLGAALIFASPLVGLAVLALGALAGAAVGFFQGERAPDIFQRDVPRREERRF